MHQKVHRHDDKSPAGPILNPVSLMSLQVIFVKSFALSYPRMLSQLVSFNELYNDRCKTMLDIGKEPFPFGHYSLLDSVSCIHSFIVGEAGDRGNI
jgi:hypothetical protein